MLMLLMSEGDNFGLNPHYIYHEYELDSLDAVDSYDASTASTDWPQFQFITQIPNIAAIKIIECQIPFSFYIFNMNNNTFILTESAGGGPKTVTIPVGNYNSTTLAAALVTALDTASANGYTYTVTYSAQTGMFTFSNSSGLGTFSFTFGVAGDPGVTNPRFGLGFGSLGTYTSTASQVLIAPNVAQITGPDYLFVNSRKIGPQMQVQLPSGALQLGAGSLGPQMAKIPINVQPFGVIFWSDPGTTASSFCSALPND